MIMVLKFRNFLESVYFRIEKLKYKEKFPDPKDFTLGVIL